MCRIATMGYSIVKYVEYRLFSMVKGLFIFKEIKILVLKKNKKNFVLKK